MKALKFVSLFLIFFFYNFIWAQSTSTSKLYMVELEITNNGTGQLGIADPRIKGKVNDSAVVTSRPSHISLHDSVMRIDFLEPIVLNIADVHSKENNLYKIVNRIEVELSKPEYTNMLSLWALNNSHVLAISETPGKAVSYTRFIDNIYNLPFNTKGETSNIPLIVKPEPSIVISGLSLNDVIANTPGKASGVQMETSVVHDVNYEILLTHKDQLRRLYMTEKFDIIPITEYRLDLLLKYRQMALEEKQAKLAAKKATVNMSSSRALVPYSAQGQNSGPEEKAFTLLPMATIKLCRSFLQNRPANSKLVILKNYRK